jgi:hypothetical protein
MRSSRIVSILAFLPLLVVGSLLVGCTNSSIPAAPAPTSSSSPATPAVTKSSQHQGAGDWGTIKGTVTWGEKDLPKIEALVINKDPAHCLKVKKEILNDVLIINPDNKGVKDAVVFLMPVDSEHPIPIHPSLKEPKVKKVEIDQPCCLFEPRVLAMRAEQELLVKNSAEIGHNFNWHGKFNEGNQAMPPNSSFTMEPLKPFYRKIPVECNIHGWMKASIWVFEHPYFAVTDADGKYEIKNAPAGTYKIALYHDYKGWLNNGFTAGGVKITIPAGDSITVDAQVPKSTD